MKINIYVVIGFVGQICYLMRFVVQWYYSEKHKKIKIPFSFWILSLVGAAFLLIYSIERRDIIFILASSLPLAIYTRNLIIHYRSKSLADDLS